MNSELKTMRKIIKVVMAVIVVFPLNWRAVWGQSSTDWLWKNMSRR